jgi:uncharacterized protein involved in exopolysaccharide biosynthesis
MIAVADKPEEGELDLRALAGKLWRRRSWIIGCVLISTIGFAAAAFLMTPVYRATTILAPADTGRSGMGSLSSALGQLGGLAALAGINLDSGNAQTQEALAVLRSRGFTETFLRERNLRPELYPGKWDASTGRWTEPEPSYAQAFRLFDKRVRSISEDKKTGLVTLRIDWKDREKAAEWANDLVARLNAEMRARALANSKASISYLQKELAATTTVETRSAIGRLLEAQLNQGMFANVTREYAFRVVDRALPPDPKDVLRPKKLVLLALGPVVGFLTGALAVILVAALARPGRERA